MAELLKDIFNDSFLERLIKETKVEYAAFNEEKFMKYIKLVDFEEGEMKERARYITNALVLTLPSDYEESFEIIKKLAPKFNGLEGMIFPDFVLVKGLEKPNISIPVLKFLTPYFSSEFAIRQFIKRYPDEMIEEMKKWATDDNHHVRRLASEGCRPRLPWGEALEDFKYDPTPIIPILEMLKEDDSEYVRKSVANNLNDISKDNPNVLIDIAKKWYGRNEKTDWILKHACRTLLKQGNREVLTLFGLEKANDVEIENLKTDKNEVNIGDELFFSFDLVKINEGSTKLRIEYVMEFVKLNQKKSKKVFKVSEKLYSKGTHCFNVKHSFKNLSTRKHYSGEHTFTLVINGEEKGKVSFQVE